jgi:hypothetical protein
MLNELWDAIAAVSEPAFIELTRYGEYDNIIGDAHGCH